MESDPNVGNEHKEEEGYLLDYPFDLYQRTRDIREVVEIIEKETGKDKLKILDVGGYRVDAADRENLLLREFLPHHDIIALDMVESTTPGYVQGDGTQLPFKDNAFDVVVSSDVYEHIPQDLRREFVENLTRTAKHFVILGAPFYSRNNELAEQILFEYIRIVLHSEHEQLKEHIENHLPDANQLKRLIEENKLNFTSIDSGNINNWLLLMMIKHQLIALPESEKLHQKFDRFLNRTQYESDHAGPAYRKVFVIAKHPDGQHTLDTISSHFNRYSKNDNKYAFAEGDLNSFELMLSMEELRARSHQDAKSAIIEAQAAKIKQLEQQRTTRLYRILLFFQENFYAPIVRFSRKFFSMIHQLFQVIRGKRKHPWLSISTRAYHRWIQKNSPTLQEINELEKINENLKYKPLISIVVPCYNTAQHWIEKALDSAIKQLYQNWELIIVNDGSKEKHVRDTLDLYKCKDNRIKPIHLRRNQGIAKATNEALEEASGEFVAFMDSDDELDPLALFEMARFINDHPKADVIYSDEDKLTLNNQREKPEFKPDWSPDLFLTYNYINHLTVCRKSLIDKVGGFRSKYDWSQDYDLYLRITEQTEHIHHLPKILYHWRSIPGSSAAKVDTRPAALASSRQLLQETLNRRKIKGIVKNGLRPATFKIKKIKR